MRAECGCNGEAARELNHVARHAHGRQGSRSRPDGLMQLTHPAYSTCRGWWSSGHMAACRRARRSPRRQAKGRDRVAESRRLATRARSRLEEQRREAQPRAEQWLALAQTALAYLPTTSTASTVSSIAGGGAGGDVKGRGVAPAAAGSEGRWRRRRGATAVRRRRRRRQSLLLAAVEQSVPYSQPEYSARAVVGTPSLIHPSRSRRRRSSSCCTPSATAAAVAAAAARQAVVVEWVRRGLGGSRERRWRTRCGDCIAVKPDRIDLRSGGQGWGRAVSGGVAEAVGALQRGCA